MIRYLIIPAVACCLLGCTPRSVHRMDLIQSIPWSAQGSFSLKTTEPVQIMQGRVHVHQTKKLFSILLSGPLGLGRTSLTWPPTEDMNRKTETLYSPWLPHLAYWIIGLPHHPQQAEWSVLPTGYLAHLSEAGVQISYLEYTPEGWPYRIRLNTLDQTITLTCHWHTWELSS